MTTNMAVVPVEPTAEMLEPFARVLCSALNLDPDEPVSPHGEWPEWYDNCAPLAVAYRAMLSAAPLGGGQGSSLRDTHRDAEGAVVADLVDAGNRFFAVYDEFERRMKLGASRAIEQLAGVGGQSEAELKANGTAALADLRAALAKHAAHQAPVSPASQVGGVDRWAGLEALAKAANDLVPYTGDVWFGEQDLTRSGSAGMEPADAAFIAAAKPSAVLELIAAARAGSVGRSEATEPSLPQPPATNGGE